MKSIKETLTEAAEALSGISESPRLDAEVLLSHVLHMSRTRLIASGPDEVASEQRKVFQALLSRRKKREPVAYLTGEKEFWSMMFYVNPDVLIPRPETELLVEHALAAARAHSGAVRILDLGTGSGCIAAALAAELEKEKREYSILAVDRSEAALGVARRNAARHGLERRIEFRHSDWFSAVRGEEKFHLILGNPPYIAEGDSRVSPETVYEPHVALFAGRGGTEQVEHILQAAPEFLASGGIVLLEFGFDQTDALLAQFPGIEIFRDYQGNSRLLQSSRR